MRNTTFSRLALLGLASVSSIAFAANTVNGEIRFDARFTTSQKTAADASVADSLKKPDNLFVSRARLDMMGDVAKNWTYGIRLEQSEAENTQLGFDPSATLPATALPLVDSVAIMGNLNSVIARAYVQWSGIEGIEIMMGRIGTPDISSNRLYYKPYIGSYPNNMSVGSVVEYSGDHAGFALDGKAGPVGYSFGVWKQTDLRKIESLTAASVSAGQATNLAGFKTLVSDDIVAGNFDAKSLRLGYGGRLSFANKMNATTSYGVGVGYNNAPLNMPIAVATISTFGVANGASPAYSITAFNNINNFVVDGSVVFGAFQLNLGYEVQTVKNDVNQVSGTASPNNQVFNYDGKANAYWVEGGYLIMGDSYKFDDSKAVISGVKLHEAQAGLEITARYGYEMRKNVSALVNATGYQDFSSVTSTDPATATSPALINASVVNVATANNYILVCVDNTGDLSSTQLVVSDEKSFEERTNGYAIGLNYYLTENAVVKAEFEQRYGEFQRIASGSAMRDSLNSKTVSTIRLRADYSF